jgi:hypothetical protein
VQPAHIASCIRCGVVAAVTRPSNHLNRACGSK